MSWRSRAVAFSSALRLRWSWARHWCRSGSPGKLPSRTASIEYALEYGTDRLEIHADACDAKARVLIVDDVLATGGTAIAAGDLVRGRGAVVAGYSFLMTLSFLPGEAALAGNDGPSPRDLLIAGKCEAASTWRGLRRQGHVGGACYTPPMLPGTFDPTFVILSVVIATMASYAALDLAGRVTAATGSARGGWLAGGAAVMGLGIWSMHFVGMLAFHLPTPIAYQLPLMLLSVVVAIAASLLLAGGGQSVRRSGQRRSSSPAC